MRHNVSRFRRRGRERGPAEAKSATREPPLTVGSAPDAGTSSAPQSFVVTHGTLARLATPITVASLSTPLVGVVDTAVIGRLGEAALIGGVASAAIIVSVVFSAFNFLLTATTGMVAQSLGANDRDEIQATMARAASLALLFGVTIVACQFAIAWAGFSLLGIGGRVLEAASAYFAVRVWSAPFVLFNYAVLGWLFGSDRVGWALALQVLLNVLNIILSIWFVIFLGWGPEGAAAAAVAAEGAASVAGLLLMAAASRSGFAAFTRQVWDVEKLRRMIVVNGDVLLRTLALFFTFAFFTRQGAAFGPVILAANAVLINLFYVSGAFMNGIAVAAQQLAGRAVGGQNRATFERVVALTTIWAVVLCVALAVTFAFGRDFIIDSMAAGADVRAAARTYFVWIAIAPIAAALAFQMDGIFIGATWSRDMRNMMLVAVAAFIAAWAILTPWLGNHGLWISFLVFLVTRSVTLRWRMRALVSATFRTP